MNILKITLLEIAQVAFWFLLSFAVIPSIANPEKVWIVVLIMWIGIFTTGFYILLAHGREKG